MAEESACQVGSPKVTVSLSVSFTAALLNSFFSAEFSIIFNLDPFGGFRLVMGVPPVIIFFDFPIFSMK